MAEQIDREIQQVRGRLDAFVGGFDKPGGGGGNLPPMDNERLAKLEAVIPTLATREDLQRAAGGLSEAIVKSAGELRTEIHKEITTQTRWIVGVLALVVAATVAISKLFT